MSEMRTKVYSIEDLSVEPGSRTFVGIASTSTPDQENEVVLAKGLVKKDYSGVPIFYSHEYIHDRAAFSIGSLKWVKPSQYKNLDAVLAKGYITEATIKAKDAFNLLQDSNIKMGLSVGFETLEESRPTQAEIKANPGWKDVKNVVRKWQLRELSLTSFPCNTECITLLASKGYSQETIDGLSRNESEVEEEINEKIEIVQPQTKEEIMRLIAKQMDSSWIRGIDKDKLVKNILKNH